MRWINREKLVFAGTGLGLCLTALYSGLLLPRTSQIGRHRGSGNVPGPIRVELRADMGRPGGPNPFDPYRRKRLADTGDKGVKEEVVKKHVDGGDGQLIVPPPPWPIDEKKREGEKKRVETPRPYEVPASFRGVHRPTGGVWRVVLEDKHTGEHRSLFAGDRWPNLNLRILRVTSNSVLLEGEKGRRFLMRDLYGRRNKKSPGDSARAELRD